MNLQDLYDVFFLTEALRAEIGSVFKQYAKGKLYFDQNDFKDANKDIQFRKLALFEIISKQMDEDGNGRIEVEEFFQYFVKCVSSNLTSSLFFNIVCLFVCLLVYYFYGIVFLDCLNLYFCLEYLFIYII